MKTLLGLFVIAHGLIHASYLTPNPNDPNYPFSFTKGWFASVAGGASKPLGVVLTLAAVICLVLAGMAIMGLPGIAQSWKPWVTVGAGLSTVLLTLYWHPWLVLGFVINFLLLIGIYELGWKGGI